MHHDLQSLIYCCCSITEPGVPYTVTVRASTVVGKGEPVSIVVFSVEQGNVKQRSAHKGLLCSANYSRSYNNFTSIIIYLLHGMMLQNIVHLMHTTCAILECAGESYRQYLNQWHTDSSIIRKVRGKCMEQICLARYPTFYLSFIGAKEKHAS